jgi:prophage regulatory protein
MTDFKEVDKLMLELVCAGLSDWEPRDRSTAVARFFLSSGMTGRTQTRSGNRAALAARRAARTKQRRILRLRQVKERTGLSKSTIYKAISEGKFPAPVHILADGKAVGWDEAEVHAYLGGRFAARDRAVVG